MTRVLRTLVHAVAILGLAAWALAVGRWLRDPNIAGGIGLALVLLLIAVALRQLYRPGGLIARPSSNPQGGDTPLTEVESAPAPLFDDPER